jgi:long-chain fatty acid transport protein
MRNESNMTRVQRYVLLTVVVVLATAMAVPAAAQTNTANFEQFQFNLATPGARAVGMGSAFIGVADDATAAVTNPAGLLALTKPQLYFEFVLGTTPASRLTRADSFFSLVTNQSAGGADFPGFVSVALPVGGRVAVSFARHQFLAYKESFAYEARLSHNGTTDNPQNGTSDFRGASYAGSVAVAVTDRKSVV